MNTVHFNYADRALAMTSKTAVKAHIVSIFKKEKKSLESIDYIFCSDDHLLQINRDFLQHDYYTDIITFDLSNPGTGIISEIYISVDRVKDNAGTHGASFQQEMLRVLFHGALHLCGYKDKKPKDVTLMREKEDYYIKSYLKKLK